VPTYIDPNTVVLSQERFLIGSSNETALYTWWVPYTFTQIPGGNFEDTSNHGFLTPDGENATIDVDGSKAIIINVLQTNYYRVNYPKENWLAIASSLIENVESVHKINRAQIIDDALNIAKAGLLEYDTGTKLSGARFI
jgi:aminopeptidase N